MKNMHELFKVLKVIFDNISAQHPQETSHFIQNEIQNPGSTKSYIILAIPSFTSPTPFPTISLCPASLRPFWIPHCSSGTFLPLLPQALYTCFSLECAFSQRNAWLTPSARCQVFLSHWFPWPSRLIL